MPWDSEEQFRAKAEGLSGLPKKIVKVEDQSPIQKQLQKMGMLYVAEATEAAAVSPPLTCPSCGQLVTDIVGATQLYQVDVKETGGKSHKGDPPPCPVSGLDLPPALFTTEPCGCRVYHDWAGGFTAELQSRMSGNPPKAVKTMTKKERDKLLAHYQDRMSALMSLQAAPNTKEQKEAVDYWLVICADQIQRLCPGAHNKKPLPKTLEPKVAEWAADKGLQDPQVCFVGEPPEIDNGTPLYRMSDGTVSPFPAYAGQAACGIAQGPINPTGKLLMKKAEIAPKITTDFVQGSSVAAATQMLELMKAGLVSNQTAMSVLPPEISKTRNGQHAVRHGNIYRVFELYDDAIKFANSLSPLAPIAVEKPLKPLQTLPLTLPLTNVFGGKSEPMGKKAWADADGMFANAHDPKYTPPPQPEPTMQDRLKAILKATSLAEMPKELLKQILEFTYTDQPTCQAVAGKAFGELGSLLSTVETLMTIRTDLSAAVTGQAIKFPALTTKFVKFFVDYVEIEVPDEPKTEDKPDGSVPVGCGGISDPPGSPKHAKKKRTIRKLAD